MPTAKPALIGIDWGTSSLRAFLIARDGQILDQASSPQGIMHTNDYAGVFHGLVQPWLAAGTLPVIASGMITSRNGWLETPYVTAPAGAAALAAALVPFTTDHGITLHFVTGMTTEHAGAPDVMRGEETQIIGAAAMGMDQGSFVMPGTHSKWIRVAEGRVEDYTTYMTGELFATLAQHTILGALMSDNSGTFHEEAFGMGIAAGKTAGDQLLHKLFHVRTLPLFGKLPNEAVADYLSGLLIGAEIQAAQHLRTAQTAVTIIGRDDLADRYEVGLRLFGIEHQRAPEAIVAAGHLKIAAMGGLLA